MGKVDSIPYKEQSSFSSGIIGFFKEAVLQPLLNAASNRKKSNQLKKSEKFIPRKTQIGLNSYSHKCQFPTNELLPNSTKHRYYMKHGELIDRLAEQN